LFVARNRDACYQGCTFSSLTTAPPFPLEVLSEMNELLLHAPLLNMRETQGIGSNRRMERV
jgi:hypothetical protein